MFENYCESVLTLKKLKEEHTRLFHLISILEEKIIQGEEEIREYVKSQKADVELEVGEEGVRFTFSQPYKQTIDFEKAMKIIQAKLKGEIKDRAIDRLREITKTEQIVDKDKFIKYVQSGELPNILRVALEETPLSPRVTKSVKTETSD